MLSFQTVTSRHSRLTNNVFEPTKQVKGPGGTCTQNRSLDSGDWFPLRLSKRQSVSLTTVLLTTTTLAWMISLQTLIYCVLEVTKTFIKEPIICASDHFGCKVFTLSQLDFGNFDLDFSLQLFFILQRNCQPYFQMGNKTD